LDVPVPGGPTVKVTGIVVSEASDDETRICVV
jgi:hypothetical protein